MAAPNTNFVPGTVHLVDLEGTLHARHAQGKSDIVLIPTPSADPDDPLNWTPRRKLLSLFCVNTYVLTVGIASAAIYSILVPISEATDGVLTVGTLNEGTGYMFLAFGWGCLFWQPMAQRFGKRPVYLFSLLTTMAIMLWAPYTTTNSQWIANKVLQGFFGAPIESLCEISVSDVYFTHERGTYMGVYALFLLGSNFFAPLISGFIEDGQGWQWVLYWCAIFCAGGFIVCFFFMEETNYHREPILSVTPPEVETEVPASIASSNDPEKAPNTVIDRDVAHGQVREYKPKTFLSKMKLFEMRNVTHGPKMAGMVIRPFVYLSFPVIFFSGFMYGSMLVWFNVLNGTASLVLSGAPYHFSSSMVGLSYISCLIGVFIGAYFCGPFGAKFVLWMARRNGGIMEPEHRLWLYCLLLIATPAGLLLCGVGAYHQVHWFGPVFAMGVIGGTITIGCQLPISYCIDSYKDLGADAIVTVILIRNTMSFAVGYGITPWVTNMGYQNAFLVAAFVALAQISLCFVFIKYGRGFREASVAKYLKYVQQARDDGLGH